MAMSRRIHGNAGIKIEELVAVDIGYEDPASALGYQRIRPGIGRRNVLLIALEHALGVRPGQGGLNLGTNRSSHGSHDIYSSVWEGHDSESCRVSPALKKDTDSRIAPSSLS